MINISWDGFRPIVSLANRLPCPPGFTFGPRIIYDHQFIFVGAGKGTARIGDQHYEAKAGDLFYYGPEIVHRFQADQGEPFVLYGLHFSLNGTLPESGVQLAAPTLDVDPAVHTQHRTNTLMIGGIPVDERLHIPECCSPGVAWVEPYFRRIAGTFVDTPNLLVHLRNRSLFTQFMLELHVWLQQSETGAAHAADLLLEVRANLKQRADQTYDRSWLSAWTSYHENHAARLFQHAFGTTPHHYFLQQKMVLAKDLLLSTDLPVGAIADRLNAGTIHYFSRMFKRHTGQSPAEFRKSRRMI